jgi:hypothetical protein
VLMAQVMRICGLNPSKRNDPILKEVYDFIKAKSNSLSVAVVRLAVEHAIYNVLYLSGIEITEGTRDKAKITTQGRDFINMALPGELQQTTTASSGSAESIKLNDICELKIYNDNGQLSIAVVTRTETTRHYLDAAQYFTGTDINVYNAEEFLKKTVYTQESLDLLDKLLEHCKKCINVDTIKDFQRRRDEIAGGIKVK